MRVKSSVQPFSTRQKMLEADYEAYRYRDSYLSEVELHHHDFYEIYFFISGKVQYTIESRQYDLKPGDILLISPLELHQPMIQPGGGELRAGGALGEQGVPRRPFEPGERPVLLL